VKQHRRKNALSEMRIALSPIQLIERQAKVSGELVEELQSLAKAQSVELVTCAELERSNPELIQRDESEADPASFAIRRKAGRLLGLKDRSLDRKSQLYFLLSLSNGTMVARPAKPTFKA